MGALLGGAAGCAVGSAAGGQLDILKATEVFQWVVNVDKVIPT
jgi:hypothetical protein